MYFFKRSATHRYLHSFPTRRSSDLSVYRKMVAHHFRSVPVVDNDGRLLGMPSLVELGQLFLPPDDVHIHNAANRDRKSTRLNSSHMSISYAVFCLKKKNINQYNQKN